MKTAGRGRLVGLGFLLLAVAALLSQRAFAADAALGKLLGGFKGIQSVKAEFSQTRSLPLLKTPVESNGSLRYLAPGHLRWEYHSPRRSLFLINGRSLKRYQWSNGRWACLPGGAGSGLGMFLEEVGRWFKGDFESGGMFNARLERGANALIMLKPTGSLRGVLQSVELTLGKAPGEISQVVIREQEGDELTIVFHRLKLNQPISREVFLP